MSKRTKLLLSALNGKGDVLVLIGKYCEAINLFRFIIEYSKDFHLESIMSKRKIADVYQKQGKIKESLKIIENVERTLKDDISEELLEKAEIYILKSNILIIKGDIDDAKKECEKVLKIIRNIRKSSSNKEYIKNIEVKVFNRLGSIYYNKGEYKKAIKVFKKNLKMCERIKDKQSISVALNTLGNIYFDKSEYDNAIEFYLKDLKICEEIGNKRGIGMSFNNLGVIYFIKNEYDKAIENFKNFLNLSEEIGNKKGIGLSNGNMGLVYYAKREYDKSIELFQKNLKIAEEMCEKKEVGRISNNLGNIYYDKNEYDKALELFQKFLKISREIGDKNNIGKANGSVGLIFYIKRDYEKAKRFFFKNLKNSQEIGDKYTVGIALINLAGLFLKIKDLQKSQKYILKSKEIFEKFKDKNNLITAYCFFSEYLMEKEEKLEKILKFVDKGLKFAEELDLKDKKAECFLTYGKIYSNEILNEKLDFKDKERIKKTIELAKKNFKMAIDIYTEINDKKSLADTYFEYGKMIKNLEIHKLIDLNIEENSNTYFNKSLIIFKELKLERIVKEIKLIMTGDGA